MDSICKIQIAQRMEMTMNKKERLRVAVKTIYDSMENTIEVEWPATHNGQNVSTFSAQIGSLFPQDDNHGLLFIGRATNGWDRECPNGSDDYENDYFMSNMERDSGKRRIFGLFKRVSQSFYGEDWYEHIAWSNVTKVAPCDKGNPSDELWNLQYDNMVTILESELHIISPSVAVFVIGSSIRCGYENPLLVLYPDIDNHLLEKVVWGHYGDNKVLTSEAYMLDNRLVILTDRPDSRQAQSFMDIHANVIISLIKKYSQI